MATIRLYDVRVVFENEPLIDRSVRNVVGGLFRNTTRGAITTHGGMAEPFRVNALDGVSLEIRHGETMGVLGPSGCGKSTLLRAIAGLIPLTSGTITYDDRDMASVPPHERGIGMVFQTYALYPHLDSKENVSFFLRIRHREEEIPEKVREVSRVMGIGFEKLLSRRPAVLSGGERQRVAVARCIARDPTLFLFDEPLSNLDAKLRVQTRSELRRLISRFKITGVYVTHDQSEALALCDRIAIMREGKIEQVGTAHFLLEHPVSAMVATFFGHPPMNVFDGVMVEDHFHADDFSVKLPEPRAADGRRISLGLRAAHITLDPNGPVAGEVVLVEPAPVTRSVLLYVESSRNKVIAQAPQDAGIHVGDRIRLNLDVSHAHFFDVHTGRRL
jgi:ABC-type sugar transport system ATPase subunit